MHQAIGAFASLVVTIFVVRFLLKRFQPQIVLMVAGLILMAVAVLLGAGPKAILPGKVASTGFIGFDLFKFIERTLSSRAGGLGMMIMAAGGFAKYMDHIGASKIMVFAVIKPLQKLKAPYLVLALAFLLGATLKVFIGSAAGLSMLLMVTIFPVIVALGASPMAAAAMVVTCGCFDLGPGSGNANLAAQNAGLNVTEYFVKYQIPVAVVGYLTVAVLHYFSAQYFDKKEKVGAIYGGEQTTVDVSGAAKSAEGPLPPQFYILLPTVPLILLLVFSDFGIKGFNLDVVTAMLISFAIALLCECVRSRDLKGSFKGCMIFFDTMGKMFASVITLIVAGETFAQGLTATGAVDMLIATAQGAGFGVTAMTITMTVFIVIAAVVMGSGNAPFFAFAALAPKIATQLGFPAVHMLLPMQIASGVARVLSPITAVVVAVAGVANVSPFDLVKRTFIPATGALITTTIASLIMF